MRGTGGTAVERLPTWARLVVGATLAAGAVGVGVAVARPDSPWCSDEGDGSCPAEVRYDGRTQAVTCTDPVAPAARVTRLVVRSHAGAEEADRVAWSVDGIPVEQVIVLAHDARQRCPGTEIAYAGLPVSQALALLHQ